jgi:tRNA(Ile)-lysidine synthase
VVGGDWVGGGFSPPAALAAAFAGRRATLSGAVIEASKGGLLFRREPAAVLGRAGETGMAPIRLPPGGRSLWDRRFIVENIFGTPAEVRPLGPAARALSGPLLPALDAAPGLFLDCALAAFPGDEGDGNSAIRALASERFARRVIRF